MPKFYMPTTILSGKNCIKRHPRHILRGGKCMIVTGKNSAEKSGALADVISVLDENNVEYTVHNKISASTGINEIYALGQEMKKAGVKYVIGIGGGTALDAAKAAAVYAANEMDPMQIYEEKYENKPLDVVCIPTTAGTGSDTTQYVMMTLGKEDKKKSFASEDCFPKVTYLDARYTLTLPLDVTRHTAMDALCHCIESYLNKNASAFSDLSALEGVRLIGQCADALISGEIDDASREKLLIAAALGGMAVAYTGLNAVHAMGHQLTCQKYIPHGMANAALLPEFISWVAKSDLMRSVDILNAFDSDLSAFSKFIKALFPSDIEITDEDIEMFLNNSIRDTVNENCPRLLTEEDERLIYKNALINKNRNYSEW